MAKTIEQILDEDLGLRDQVPNEKIASQQDTAVDEIEKLAKEVGLLDEAQAPAQNSTMHKEANMSMESLYGNLFPEDQDLGATKVASAESSEQEKIAAEKEAAIGARAYDIFAERFGTRVTKLASESVQHSSGPAQELPNNKPADADKAINANSGVNAEGDTLKAKNDEKQVGHTEQKMAMAMRKHLLLSQLEK